MPLVCARFNLLLDVLWHRFTLFILLAALMGTTPLQAARPVFSFVGSTTVKEGDGQIIVFIGKNAKSSSYSKIRVTTSDGTAKAGSDYTAVSQTITVANSQLTVVVAIPILNDTIFEPTESFTVTMTPVRNATIATPSEQITITDDDAAPSPQWVSAPLKQGGYARIVKSEPAEGTTPPGVPLGYMPPVGSVWYMIPKAWGCTAGEPCRYVWAVQPIDQIGTAWTGFYVYLDDLEGVAPAAPALAAAMVPSTSTVTATKTCMTHLGGASQQEARSGVVKGQRYRISRKWTNQPGYVGAINDNPGDGMAVVPETCFK